MFSAAHWFERVAFWIMNSEHLFWFFPLHLPVENDNKYSIFKIQNAIRPNLWAAKDTSSTNLFIPKSDDFFFPISISF